MFPDSIRSRPSGLPLRACSANAASSCASVSSPSSMSKAPSGVASPTSCPLRRSRCQNLEEYRRCARECCMEISRESRAVMTPGAPRTAAGTRPCRRSRPRAGRRASVAAPTVAHDCASTGASRDRPPVAAGSEPRPARARARPGPVRRPGLGRHRPPRAAARRSTGSGSGSARARARPARTAAGSNGSAPRRTVGGFDSAGATGGGIDHADRAGLDQLEQHVAHVDHGPAALRRARGPCAGRRSRRAATTARGRSRARRPRARRAARAGSRATE